MTGGTDIESSSEINPADVLMRQLKTAKFPWFSNAQACKTEWLPQLNAYGDFVQQHFQAAPEKFYFLPNLGGFITTWDRVTKLDVGDGGMVEGFAMPRPGQFYSPEDWKLQMTRIVALVAKEEIVLCQTRYPKPEPGVARSAAVASESSGCREDHDPSPTAPPAGRGASGRPSASGWH
ncbi:hypothetical protein BH10PLA1_BH10PLA1_17120 [soil metagenome]